MLFSRLFRTVEPFQDAAAMSVGNVDVPRVSSTWRTDEVSKIIHQTAPSDESKWHPIWAKCQATWKAKFPNHTYMFWNDQDIDTFIQTKFPKFYPAFKNYPHHIQRVDVARYFILYEYGGIYADMDYECVQNFESLLPRGRVSIGTPTNEQAFQNALMASPPKHPFWHYVFAEVLAFRDYQADTKMLQVLSSTGPSVIERVARVVPQDMLNPLPSDKFDVNTVAVHDPKRTELIPHANASSIYAYNYGTLTWAN